MQFLVKIYPRYLRKKMFWKVETRCEISVYKSSLLTLVLRMKPGKEYPLNLLKKMLSKLNPYYLSGSKIVNEKC